MAWAIAALTELFAEAAASAADFSALESSCMDVGHGCMAAALGRALERADAELMASHLDGLRVHDRRPRTLTAEMDDVTFLQRRYRDRFGTHAYLLPERYDISYGARMSPGAAEEAAWRPTAPGSVCSGPRRAPREVRGEGDVRLRRQGGAGRQGAPRAGIPPRPRGRPRRAAERGRGPDTGPVRPGGDRDGHLGAYGEPWCSDMGRHLPRAEVVAHLDPHHVNRAVLSAVPDRGLAGRVLAVLGDDGAGPIAEAARMGFLPPHQVDASRIDTDR